MTPRSHMPHDEKTTVAMATEDILTGEIHTTYPRVYRNGIWAMQKVSPANNPVKHTFRLIHVPSGHVVFRGPYRSDRALYFVDMLAFLLPDKGAEMAFGTRWKCSLLPCMWSWCTGSEEQLQRAGERYLAQQEFLKKFDRDLDRGALTVSFSGQLGNIRWGAQPG